MRDGIARAVRGARLRRHRPGAGARLRAARRASAGSARTPASSIPSSDPGSSSARSSAACRSTPTRRRSISAAPARCASRRVRRRRSSRPGVLDATPLHFVPDDRASRRRFPTSARRRHRHARLRLRHLPGSLSVERAAPRSDDPAWQPRPVWDRPSLVELVADAATKAAAALRGSPMKRAKSRACGAISRSRKTNANASTARDCTGSAHDLRKVARALSSEKCLSRWRRRFCCRCRRWWIRTSTGRSSCCASTATKARSGWS